jgi:hypothetical protein
MALERVALCIVVPDARHVARHSQPVRPLVHTSPRPDLFQQHI